MPVPEFASKAACTFLPFRRMAFQPVENYGVIGNMKSVALVGMNGSIDFLSYPDFDSPTVFAALLDEKQRGRFQIEPQLTDMGIRQPYLPDTNILLRRFLAEEGVAELTDFMPIEKDTGQPNEIVRTVTVIISDSIQRNLVPMDNTSGTFRKRSRISRISAYLDRALSGTGKAVWR
jgi:GH15 family glucan-1,4-alpha-glucosidase